MKRCDHTLWLSLCTQGDETSLLESDRLQTLTHQLQDPDTQQPSLFVLIGNTTKSQALRELFGIKRTRKFGIKRTAGEIHLHLDPATIFHSRPIFVAGGDLPNQILQAKVPSTEKCHETIRRALPGALNCTSAQTADNIYPRLLLPFADVICFFSADVGGFRQIARHIAVWLEAASPSTPQSTCPRVIIVTEKIPPEAEREKEARKAFLWLLREETSCDLFEHISAIDVVALLPHHKVSAEARYRRLKECFLNRSDEVRRNREETQTLFSATHFAALFRYACGHASQVSASPFDFIKASRKQNPIANDLAEHLSIFLKHIKSAQELTEFAVPVIASSILLDSYPPDAHEFAPESVFQTLYKDIFHQVSDSRVLFFKDSPDVILRSGFISMIQKRLCEFFDESIGSGTPSLDIHRRNLKRLEGRWRNIQSSTTCLCCLRRRPQYGLTCGHIVCENCVIIFGECSVNDTWIYKVRNCFVCGVETHEEVVIKIHPPTAGVGILCIDGGGTRGVLPLKFLQRIQDQIGLQIPLQKFFKVVFGTSSGSWSSAGLFIEGWSVNKSLEKAEVMAKAAFQRRKRLGFPIISGIIEFCISYMCDGLYPATHIEAALKDAFKNRRILDCSYATSIGTKVGLLVATIRDPLICVFTNYNGIGTRDPGQAYHVVQPSDEYGNVSLWEIARSASAAPGFFPPKDIRGVGTFQDAGPLQNDPLVTALSEVAAMFPLVEEPDFIVSLGTGAPRTKGSPSMSTYAPHKLWKDRAFSRLWRMFWERMRDQQVKQVFRTHPRYYRLDTEFDEPLPRLDNTMSMPGLQLKAQEDLSVSKVVRKIARCAIASLFHFELRVVPDGSNGYTGSGLILCSIRHDDDDPALEDLLDRLSRDNATFYLDDCPISGTIGDNSFIGDDGNFRKRVDLNLAGKFTISLKQGKSEPCHISGSPYSVEKLISAQELDAPFGRADHRKRKRSVGELSARKRLWVG